MLYFMMTDDEILSFYGKLKKILADQPYKIIYLDVEDISGTIDVIRKERSDDDGNELWFPMMIKYLEESPGGRKYALTGRNGLFVHLERRRDLERRMIDEVFKEKAVIVKAKEYELGDVLRQ